MSACGVVRAAMACNAWDRPISPPSLHTAALFDMFCALKGATRTPLFAKHRHNAAANKLFPAEELVPITMSVRPRLFGNRYSSIEATSAPFRVISAASC